MKYLTSSRSVPVITSLLTFFLAGLFSLSTASAQSPAAPAAALPAAAPAAVIPAANPAAKSAPAPVALKPQTSGDALEGKIAFYGAKFNGRKTASGERFNASAMTMAHKTLPFGTLVKVSNPKNKRSVVVRVNDRGPSTPDRIGDLTRAAALKLGIVKAGTADVTLTIVGKSKAKKSKAKP